MVPKQCEEDQEGRLRRTEPTGCPGPRTHTSSLGCVRSSAEVDDPNSGAIVLFG